MIIFFKGYSTAKVAKSHIIVLIIVTAVYLLMLLNWQGIITGGLKFGSYTISILTVFIIILYAFGVKHMAGDESVTEDDDTNTNLTVKQIVTRFILVSIGIILVSIIVTNLTDKIAIKLGLGAGLAGALFLGVATSLPELVSTFSLFRLKNYNVGIGNIIGSNIFNFLILSIADICYFGNKTVFDYSDPKNINLLVFGGIASLVMLISFKFKNKVTQALGALIVIACYVAFLVI